MVFHGLTVANLANATSVKGQLDIAPRRRRGTPSL